MKLLTLLLATFLIQAFAGPINKSQFDRCAKTCSSGPKFKYLSGKTYEYDLSADTFVKLEGASKEQSGTHVTAEAEIEAIDGCEFALHIHEGKLWKSEGGSKIEVPGANPEFGRELSSSSLRFAFQDGKITELCPSGDEKTWALNLKRAVLSAFQNSMSDFNFEDTLDEIDVAGKCPTQYRVISSSGPFTIKRTKSMIKCSSRYGRFSSLQGTPYELPEGIKSLPITDSKNECIQKVSPEGILLTAECKESHLFRPFSKGNSGALSTSEIKLVYRKKVNHDHSIAGEIGERTSLMFDHEEAEREKVQEKEVMDHLKLLCENTHTRFSRQIPKHFNHLISLLKGVDHPTIRKVHTQAERTLCSHARHYFHDSLPLIGTEHSVRLMKELIVADHVSKMETNKFLASLNFITKPTPVMLRSLKTILKKMPSHHSLLTTSALIHRYCNVNPECGSMPEVTDLVETFEAVIGHDCSFKSSSDQKKIMLALKAIGNVGHGVSKVQNLQRCASNKALPMEMRIAAIDAFRRIGCHVKRNGHMAILENTSEDSEIKIIAYLSLMRCHTPEILRKIKAVLFNEKSDQVGNFIFTHLRNKMSSSPHEDYIREILEDRNLAARYDMSKNTFSRHFSKSFFWDQYNTGAKAEATIIWSDRSILPRSGNLNLTIDMFGNAVNLLEFGGRVEGLEELLDTYFGKNGLVKPGAYKRPPRSLRKSLFDVNMKGLKVSASLKIFGTEVAYGTEDVFEKKASNLGNILQDMIKKPRVDFSKTLQFIDTQISIPTVTGLPLKLSVNGTASVHLNLRKSIEQSNGITVHASVQPSAVVEVTSNMHMDSFYHTCGLQMVSNLYSSFSARGSLSVRKNQHASVSFSLPETKNEIMRFSHKFYIDGKEMKMTGKPQEVKKCSGKWIGQKTDLELCADLSYTIPESKAPYIPLSSPVEMGITLKKLDPATSYTAKLTFHEQQNKKIVKLLIDTPNTKIDRKISMIAEKEGEKVGAILKTPWTKEVAVVGEYKNGAEEREMNFEVKYDGRKRLGVKSSVSMRYGQSSKTITPSLTIEIPGRPDIGVSGTFQKTTRRRIFGSVKVMRGYGNPIEFKGEVQRAPVGGGSYRYEVKTSLKSYLLKYNLHSWYKSQSITKSSESRLKYTWLNNPEQKVDLDFTSRFNRKPGIKTIKLAGSFSSTINPKFNCKFDVDNRYNRLAQRYESKISAAFGPVPKANEFIMTTEFQHAGTKGPEEVNAQLDFAIKYLPKNIDYSVKLSHEHNRNTLQSSGKFTHMGKPYGYNFGVRKIMQNERMILEGNGHINTPYGKWGVRNSLRRTRRSVSNQLSISQGQNNIRMTGKYTTQGAKRGLDMKIEGSMIKSPISIVGHVMLVDPLKEVNVFGSIKHNGLTYQTSLVHKVKEYTPYTSLVTDSTFEFRIPQGLVKVNKILNVGKGAINLDGGVSVDFGIPKSMSHNIKITYDPNSFKGDMGLTYMHEKMGAFISGQRSDSSATVTIKTSYKDMSTADILTIKYPGGWKDVSLKHKSELKNIIKQLDVLEVNNALSFKTSPSKTSGAILVNANGMKPIDMSFEITPNKITTRSANEMGPKYSFKHKTEIEWRPWCLDVGYTMSMPTQFSGSLKFDARDVPATLELTLNPIQGQEFSVKGSLTHRKTGFLDVTLNMQIPSFSPLTFKVTALGEKSPYKIEGSIIGLGPVVKFTNEFARPNSDWKSISNKFSGSYSTFAASSLMTFDMTDKIVTHFDVIYNNLEFVKLDNSFDHKSWKEVDFQTSFESSLPTMTFGVRYNVQRLPFSGSLEAGYGTSKIDIKTNLENKDSMKEFRITSKITSIKPTSLTVSWLGEFRPVKVIVKANYGSKSASAETWYVFGQSHLSSGAKFQSSWTKFMEIEGKVTSSPSYFIQLKGVRGSDQANVRGELKEENDFSYVKAMTKSENMWMPWDMEASMDRRKMPMKMDISGKYSQKTVKMSGDMTVDGWKYVNAKFSANHEQDSISGKMIHNIRDMPYKHEMEANYNQEKIKIVSNVNGMTSHEIKMESPWMDGSSNFVMKKSSPKSVSWTANVGKPNLDLKITERKEEGIPAMVVDFTSSFTPEIDITMGMSRNKALTRLLIDSDKKFDFSAEYSSYLTRMKMTMMTKYILKRNTEFSYDIISPTKFIKMSYSPKGKKAMSISAQAETDSTKAAKVTIITDIMKKRTVKFNYDLKDNEMKKTVSFSYSPANEKSLTVEGEMATKDFTTMNMKITTDFKKERTMEFTYNSVSKDKIFTFEYSPKDEKPLALHGRINFGTRKANLMYKCPRTGKYTLDSSWQNENKKFVKAKLTSETKELGSIDIGCVNMATPSTCNINIKTDIKKPREFDVVAAPGKLTINYNVESKKSSFLVVEYPTKLSLGEQKFMLKFFMPYTSLSWDAKIEIYTNLEKTFQPNSVAQFIRITSPFEGSSKEIELKFAGKPMGGVLQFKSPFTEPMTLEASLSGSPEEFTATSIASYMNGKQTKITIKRNKLELMEMDIDCPCQYVGKMNVKSELKAPDWRDIDHKLSFTSDIYRSMSSELIFKQSLGDSGYQKVSLELKASKPIYGYRQMKYAQDTTMQKTSYSLASYKQTTAVYMDQKTILKTIEEMTFNSWRDFVMKKMMESIWHKPVQYVLTVKVPTNKDIDVSLTGSYGSQKGSIALKNIASKGKCYGSIEIETPFERYSTLSHTWDYKKTGDDVAVVMTVKCPRGESKLDIKTNTVMPHESSITLTTPYSGFRKWSTAFKLNGELSNFEGSIICEKEDKPYYDIKANGVFVGTNRNFVLSHKCAWGYDMGMSLTANQGSDSIDANVEVTVKDEKMSLGVMVKNPKLDMSKKFAGVLSIETPFKPVKSFALRIDNSQIRIKLNNKMRVHMETTGPTLLKRSFKSYAPVVFEANIDLTPRNSKVDFIWDNEKSRSFSAEYDVPTFTRRQGFKISGLKATINYPRDNPTREVTLVMSLNCKKNSFEHDLEFSWKSGKKVGYSISAILERETKALKIGLTGLTRSMSLTGAHDSTKEGVYISEGRITWDKEDGKYISVHNTLSAGDGRYKNDIEINSHYFSSPKQVKMEMSMMKENIFDFNMKFDRSKMTIKVEEKGVKNYTCTVYTKYAYKRELESELIAHVAPAPIGKTMSSGLTIWSKIDGNKKEVYFYSQTDARSNALMEIQSPWKSMTFDWKIVKTPRGYKVMITDVYDGRPITFEADIKTKMRSADFELSIDPSTSYYLVVKLEDIKEPSLDVYMMKDGKKMNIVTGTFHLNARNIISSKLIWQSNDIPQMIQDSLEAKFREMMASREELKKSVKKTVNRYLKALSDDHKELIEKFLKAIYTEVTSFGDDNAKMIRVLSQMYEGNDFYFKDIIEFVQSLSEKTKRDSSRVVRSVSAQTQGKLTNWWNKAKEHTKKATEYGKGLVNKGKKKACEYVSWLC